MHLHEEDKRLVRSEMIFPPRAALRGFTRSFVVVQEHALDCRNPISQCIPGQIVCGPIAQHQSLLVLILPSIRENLLARGVHNRPVSIDEQIKVLLAQLQHRCPELVDGIGVLDGRCSIESRIVVVDRHPGPDIGACEATIGAIGPLDRSTRVIARFFPILLQSGLLGFGVEVLAFDQSNEQCLVILAKFSLFFDPVPVPMVQTVNVPVLLDAP